MQLRGRVGNAPFWTLVIGLGVLFFHSGGYWSAHWASKWAYLIAVFSIGISAFVARRTHWVIFPLLAYSLLNAWAIGFWPQNMYVGGADSLTLIALEKNALLAYVYVLAAGLALAFYKKDMNPGGEVFLFALATVAIATTLLSPERAGLTGFYFGNPSMNGCMIAALFPLLWDVDYDFCSLTWGRRAWRTRAMLGVLCGATLGALYLVKSSVPYGVLAIGLALYALARLKSAKALWISVGVAGGLLAVGLLTQSHEFFNPNGRFEVWKQALTYWSFTPWRMLFGTGLGTTLLLMPILQVAHDPSKAAGLFMWLHNDWLQLLFEGGIIAALFVIAPWAYLLKKAWRVPWLFGVYGAFSAMAFFNYPVRLPVHAFAWLLVCGMILRD